MRLASLPCMAALLAGLAGPALADAVTYRGTVGTLPVILELGASPEEGGTPSGRYAYLSKGTDIPLNGAAGPLNGAAGLLNGAAGKTGTIRLDEEAACTEESCAALEGGDAPKAPVGAEWTLRVEAGGARLKGTWRNAATGRTLPVRLARQGSRVVDTTGYGPVDGLDPSNALVSAGQPAVMTPEEFPYDFLKMDWPLEKGPETRIGEAVARIDTDARVAVPYPTVVTLGGDADVAPVNAYLAQQRLQFELPAFRCGSNAYLGLGWSGADGQGTNGYDGNASVTVEHLTPRLMGVSESGSYWCGGAYPENFTTHRLVDAATGDALQPESILRGWLAFGRDDTPVDPATYNNEDGSLTFRPSDALVAYVKEHRQRFDAQTESDCGIDDLIAGNLGVYVKENSLVFTLRDLPHAIFACTDDLVEVPLKDARPLLTDEAAGYFAVLDR